MNLYNSIKTLPIIKIQDCQDLKSFINFWSRFYSDPYENLYLDNIQKEDFSSESIQQLYTWKNGMKLSKLKKESLDKKIIKKLSSINLYKQSKDWNIQEFNDEFQNITAVWKIFLLHIIKPEKYPIYDQNIHRCYNFIHDLEYKDMSEKII